MDLVQTCLCLMAIMVPLQCQVIRSRDGRGGEKTEPIGDALTDSPTKESKDYQVEKISVDTCASCLGDGRCLAPGICCHANSCTVGVAMCSRVPEQCMMNRKRKVCGRKGVCGASSVCCETRGCYLEPNCESTEDRLVRILKRLCKDGC